MEASSKLDIATMSAYTDMVQRWQLDEERLVAATAQSIHQLEASLRKSVAKARHVGLPWEQVASALGTARQSAWRRFKEESVTVKTKKKKTLRICSFCGEPQNKVKHLVAAPTGASICGECLDLASKMLQDARSKKD